jgi:hypothetical protein
MAVTVGQPRHSGRFDTTLGDDALMEVIAAVGRYPRPDTPQKVSTRRVDAARAGAGYPDCPTARAITRRLNRDAKRKLSWQQIIEVALGENRNLAQTLVAAEREEPAEHLDDRHAFFALRYVARHAARETLSRDEYAQERRKLLAAARRRGDAATRRRGDDTLAELLPTLGQIERLFDGNWDDALDAAELTPREKFKAAGRPPGLPPEQAMAAFVKENDWWPTKPVLSDFCGQLKIRFGRTAMGQTTIADVREKAKALLAAEGIARPSEDKPPRDAKTRPLHAATGRIPGADELSADGRWKSEEECVAAQALRGALPDVAAADAPALRELRQGPGRLPFTHPLRGTRRLHQAAARRARRDRGGREGATRVLRQDPGTGS